jgi:predicted  nucleic acid-binding Zn-ribbon protein
MVGPAEIFRDIHRLRRFAQGLKAEIERGPRMLKAQQNKITAREQALHQGQEAIKKLKVGISEKELEIKAVQQQIGKYEQQRNQATSKKEYDAFTHEIEDCRRKCQKVEDQILELMLEIDQKTAEVPELEKAIKQAKEERAKFEQEHQGRVVGLREQLKQAQQDLAAAEAQLQPDVTALYRRLVSAMGEDALSSAPNRSCTACNTEITAQQYNELRLATFVQCKSCGRILYLPE